MNVAVDYGNLSDTVKLIKEIGGEDPESEASILYSHASSPEELDVFINRRLNHEPVAYIVGSCKFDGLTFTVDPRSLIPRAETETLLDAGQEAPKNAFVADIGTGCGAVAIALKKRRPDLQITGIDISKDALDLATINSEKHEVYINWRDGDLLRGDHYRFNTILANLPYLPTRERAEFLPEMTENEPQIALWGGEDGLDLISRLLKETISRPWIKMVGLEIQRGRENDVMELIRRYAFPTVFGITDKKGEIRAVVGKRD